MMILPEKVSVFFNFPCLFSDFDAWDFVSDFWTGSAFKRAMPT
jgi:hypothetical protein